jgi:hypothetical protein
MSHKSYHKRENIDSDKSRRLSKGKVADMPDIPDTLARIFKRSPCLTLKQISMTVCCYALGALAVTLFFSACAVAAGG